jgi:hypothetical protein
VEETGNSATLAARLKDLEGEKARLREECAHVADKAKIKAGLRALTTKQVQAMLEFVPTSPNADVAYHRRALAALVRRVELEPGERIARVQYSVGLGGVKLASPRGCAVPH